MRSLRPVWLALLFLAAFVLGTTSTNWLGRSVYDLASPDPFWTEAGSATLTTEEQSNIDIYERASKATVNITSTVLQRGWFFEVFPVRESGSGFLISEDGRILTNNHVIRGDAPQIEVTLLGDGEEARYEAEVLAVDEINDLALIQIKPDRELPWLPLGNSDELRVGQKVLAIGNPFGLQGTLTTGVISSVGRSIRSDDGILEDMIQTDAAINPGNSGGPLLDSSGAVIGINTAIYGSQGSIGIGFAMPVSRARPLLEFVRSGGDAVKPQHPGFTSVYLSGRLASALKLPPGGYLVQEVEPGSAAAAAGLRGATREVRLGNYVIPWGGDYIIEVDGRRVTNQRFFQQALGLKRGGDTVRLKVVRGAEEVEVELVLRAQAMRL